MKEPHNYPPCLPLEKEGKREQALNLYENILLSPPYFKGGFRGVGKTSSFYTA
jgi:hypothetical protein